MHVKGCEPDPIPLFHILKLSKYKPDGNDSSSQVQGSSGIHNTINSHKYREESGSVAVKQNLPGQGHDHAKFCLSDRCKESGGHWLNAIDKCHKHKYTEIPFRKPVICFISTTKQSNDLAWKYLEAGKKYNTGNNSCQAVFCMFPHPVKFFPLRN